MDSINRKRRKSGSMQAILGVALSAFLLGALIVGYFSWRDGGPLSSDEEAVQVEEDAPDAALTASPTPGASPTPSPTASEATVRAAEEATEAVERVAEQQGGLEQRLAAAEQRLARLDLQAQAASGNAARAEGLLIAFAARRSIERGAELGYLADQLRLRFGDALPNAVATIIENSRDPITLDQLIARLDGLAPQLRNTSEDFTFERFRRELSDIFTVRRETAPSPQPERRIERARLFLESGRVSAAIEEVQNMPGADSAEDWIADAKRFASTQRALDLIETSAVLEPTRLRDREGQRVEQPGPGAEPVSE